MIASNGLTQARVARRPRIMVVISTGNELVEPGQPLADWQIYRSNAYAVLTRTAAARLRRAHTTICRTISAYVAHTARARISTRHDVLILSGGVSMGRFDYVPQVLSELGVNSRVSQGRRSAPASRCGSA